MNKLVLLRHGQSDWNKQNRFTGWTDVDLTEEGIREARHAGEILNKYGYTFDVAFTSLLKRAIRTLWITLHEMNLDWIPVYKTWRLNERHYGSLQGLNKEKTAEKYGKEQVYKWRRYVNVRPPALNIHDKRYPGFEPKYKNLDVSDIPLTENLNDTEKRVLEFWYKSIAPTIKSGKKVIISAHGNTLRALVKYLDNIPDNGIVNLNIPTGIPIVYELDDNLKAIKHYFLGEEDILTHNDIPLNITKGEQVR